MSQKSRSPLKDKPLRLPGQSLQEQRQDLWDDKFLPSYLVAVLFAIMAALEWFRYFRSDPPRPVLMTAVAGIAITFVLCRFFRLRPQMLRLKQGMDGERAVGQFLERLREQGYQVLHDVPGDGFNLDHVCIGPGGAFTVETKTWSKPSSGNARIQFDGQRLLVNGHEPERDVVAQAQAQATWLARTLQESTGRSIPVQPVVVFPGWFVEASPGAHKSVWVMEPKGLPAFLANEPARLLPEEVKLAAFHLSRYVRTYEHRV